jgi:acyl-CoA dehydrogenase
MSFYQDAPVLGNQYDDDVFAQQYIARVLPEAVRTQVIPQYRELGALAAGPLYQFHLADRLHEPVHTEWNAWGQRVDDIEVSPLWVEAQKLAASGGLVGAGYEKRFGPHDRVHQFLSNYFV